MRIKDGIFAILCTATLLLMSTVIAAGKKADAKRTNLRRGEESNSYVPPDETDAGFGLYNEIKNVTIVTCQRE
jgi:hypothetical protein